MRDLGREGSGMKMMMGIAIQTSRRGVVPGICDVIVVGGEGNRKVKS